MSMSPGFVSIYCMKRFWQYAQIILSSSLKVENIPYHSLALLSEIHDSEITGDDDNRICNEFVCRSNKICRSLRSRDCTSPSPSLHESVLWMSLYISCMVFIYISYGLHTFHIWTIPYGLQWDQLAVLRSNVIISQTLKVIYLDSAKTVLGSVITVFRVTVPIK